MLPSSPSAEEEPSSWALGVRTACEAAAPAESRRNMGRVHVTGDLPSWVRWGGPAVVLPSLATGLARLNSQVEVRVSISKSLNWNLLRPSGRHHTLQPVSLTLWPGPVADSALGPSVFAWWQPAWSLISCLSGVLALLTELSQGPKSRKADDVPVSS